MSKKICTISKANKRAEGDRDDMIIKVQNENTQLIRECNTLREERQELKDHVFINRVISVCKFGARALDSNEGNPGLLRALRGKGPNQGLRGGGETGKSRRGQIRRKRPQEMADSLSIVRLGQVKLLSLM
jgi:hypothetical protein